MLIMVRYPFQMLAMTVYSLFVIYLPVQQTLVLRIIRRYGQKKKRNKQNITIKKKKKQNRTQKRYYNNLWVGDFRQAVSEFSRIPKEKTSGGREIGLDSNIM